jgi:hypothetical protein
LGNPTGSNTVIGLALRFTGTPVLLHHDRVKIQLKGDGKSILNTFTAKVSLVDVLIHA